MVEFEKYQSSRVSGASAFEWTTRTTRMVFVVLAAVVVAIVVGTIAYNLPASAGPKGPLSVIGQVLLYVFFATLVTFFICGIRGRVVESAEKSRGYSTLPLQKDAVDVIDVVTGLIIRHASDQPLRDRGDIGRARIAVARQSTTTKT